MRLTQTAYALTCTLIMLSSAIAAESIPPSVSAAQGTVTKGADGKLIQVRFPGWPSDDFSQYSTHSYKNMIPPLKIAKVKPNNLAAGDPVIGASIWLKSACINCHSIPGAAINEERWAGNVGPSLAGYGLRKVDPARTYQTIYDQRAINPQTLMPAWGTTGILAPQEIMHLVSFLNTLTNTNNVADIDSKQTTATRPLPTSYFGDNLDPTRNPAALHAEHGETLWSKSGPKQKSCASCHGTNIEQVMRGKATTYPRYSSKYKRVVSIEDLVALHGEEKTGLSLPLESDDNLNLSMIIKMQSNGMPIAIDLKDKKNKAAWEQGRQTFYKRIGQRNHSCADCHAAERVKDKWLGGRYISRADASLGLTHSYPAWRTSFGQTWGLRRRVQWCMLPHGANNLPAGAVEYADMELYLTALENGKNINVPGIKD